MDKGWENFEAHDEKGPDSLEEAVGSILKVRSQTAVRNVLLDPGGQVILVIKCRRRC